MLLSYWYSVPLDSSKKTINPFELLRGGRSPRLIIYDVLGHFPAPRDHLSVNLCQQFNLRSRNGLLFSTQHDLVMASLPLDTEHQAWLRRSGFAQGETFLVPAGETLANESFLEHFLKNKTPNRDLRAKLVSLGISKIFSWMNSPNEIRLANELNLETCWSTPSRLVQEQFDKISFKKCLQELELPLTNGFVISKDEISSGVFDLEKRCSTVPTHKKWIARPAAAAAGSGIFTFTPAQTQAASSRMRSALPTDWLIEEFFEDSRSINLQVFVSGPGRLEYLGVSEQYLKQFMYSGNHGVSGASDDESLIECLRQAEIIGLELAKHEYVGLIGLDFIITPRGQVHAIENNIRINGSTFSLALLAELENALQTQLSWSFEKMGLSHVISFGQVQKLLDGILLTLNEPRVPAVFIQEYYSGQTSTDFAFIYFGRDAEELQSLRARVNLLLGHI